LVQHRPHRLSFTIKELAVFGAQREREAIDNVIKARWG
jgi:hypothetical protein